jgi:hypothetical protein
MCGVSAFAFQVCLTTLVEELHWSNIRPAVQVELHSQGLLKTHIGVPQAFTSPSAQVQVCSLQPHASLFLRRVCLNDAPLHQH